MAEIDGAWFRAKLTEKNRSQRALARHLDIDPGAVTLMFNGKRRMQLDEAEQIAVFLGVPVADVLRAAGLPISGGGSAPAPRAAPATDPVAALKAKRDELLAKVDALNRAIEVLEK